MPRRRNADYRWTPAKIVAFLRGLSITGSVAAAARSVGMSRQSAYRLRARLEPGFAAVWDEGLAFARVMRGAAPIDAQGDAAGHKATRKVTRKATRKVTLGGAR